MSLQKRYLKEEKIQKKDDDEKKQGEQDREEDDDSNEQEYEEHDEENQQEQNEQENESSQQEQRQEEDEQEQEQNESESQQNEQQQSSSSSENEENKSEQSQEQEDGQQNQESRSNQSKESQQSASEEQDQKQGESNKENQQKAIQIKQHDIKIEQTPKVEAIINQILCLNKNVDHFISSLSSQGGNTYRSRNSKTNSVQKEQISSIANQINTISIKQIPKPFNIKTKKQPVPKKEQIDININSRTQIAPLSPSKSEINAKKVSQKQQKSPSFMQKLHQQNKKLNRWRQPATPPKQQSFQNKGLIETFGKEQKFERKQAKEKRIKFMDLDEHEQKINEAISILKSEGKNPN